MKHLRIKRLPLFAELYLFMVVTMILPLAFVTINGSGRFLAYSEQEIIQSAADNLVSLEKYADSVRNNLVGKVINLSRDGTFNEMVRIKEYDALRTDAKNFDIVRRLSNRLKDLIFSDRSLHSAYFWPQDRDYLVTTRNDTVELEGFYDLGWLDAYQAEWSGTGNHWISRKQPYEILTGEETGATSDVLTYLYRTTNYTTNAHGVIVVNLFEKDFSRLLNNEQEAVASDSAVFAVDAKGRVMTHPDKAQFAADLSADPAIARILAEPEKTGSFIDGAGGVRTLTCWSHSELGDWTYVSRHSLTALLDRSNALRNQQLLLMLLFSLAGLLLAFVFSRLVTLPLRRLVGSIRSRDGGAGRPEDRANELVYLSDAFERISEQEAGLGRLLRQSEESLAEKHLLEVLKGDVSTATAETVQGLFPHASLMVAMVEIDRAQAFRDRYTPDQRAVMKALARQRCLQLANDALWEAGSAPTSHSGAQPAGRAIQCVLFDDNMLAIVLSLPSYDWNRTNAQLRRLLGTLQSDLAEILGSTVSIGVSGCHGAVDALPDAAREALEAVRRKLLAGMGSLQFHSPQMSPRGRYFYPFDREKILLNCLSAGNGERLEEQLRELSSELRRMDISCDNIVQIYNQLVSSVIRYLAENGSAAGTGSVLWAGGSGGHDTSGSGRHDTGGSSGHGTGGSSGHGSAAWAGGSSDTGGSAVRTRTAAGDFQAMTSLQSLYADIAGLETLSEIEEYMVAFFRRLMPQLQTQGGDQRNIDRIVAWIGTHYASEINFESMAEELKISYSYIRRLVKESTGKGLLDYVNGLRIQEAKRLLRQTAMPIGEIAAQLGYNNAQSFTRFFKKFEGVTPGEYRNAKG